MHRMTSVVAAAVAVSASLASAQLLEVDSEFGMGSVTRDVAQNLDFLDVTISTGLSFNDVTAAFASGGVFEGWRHATRLEVATMVNNWGFSPAVPLNDVGALVVADQFTDPFDGLVTLLGPTIDASSNPSNSFRTSNGLTATDPGTQLNHVVRLEDRLQSVNSFARDVYEGGNITLTGDEATSQIGHFLVRTVPAPGALAIFAGAGLAAAQARRRRR